MNLDAMTRAELSRVANNPGDSNVRKYARLKLQAMAYRELGQIRNALACEAQCDSVYIHIPEDLKW